MDERVARVKTSEDARQLAENALRLGRLDVHAQALERARDLRATEEGFISPAQRAIATALYAYEEEQSRLKARPFRANRTRRMLAEHGALGAAERMVLHRQPSKGFEVLEGAGLRELSFEAIIDRFPDEFSSVAVQAARARLKGESPPSPMRATPSLSGSLDESDDNMLAPAALDGEARSFLNGVLDRGNPYLTDWLPRYRETVGAIEQALSDDRPQDVFDTIWRTRDNSVANAGQGVMNYKVVDTMREELIQVIRDIHEDASPANFERIVERFEGWSAERRIDAIPRLMIARAFAGVHPRHYHTTVHGDDQSRALDWFVDHTGFVMPTSSNWAVRARALVAHLNRENMFGAGDVLVRNMFPWFVVAQLRARAAHPNIKPGHKQRPDTAFAHLPESQRTIELRHNRVQTALFKLLAKQFGEDRVWTEYPTGTGGYADAIVRPPDGGCLLYEIKIADSAAEVVRQAMGQLLEYGFRRGGLEPIRLFVVGEPVLDNVTRDFIARLHNDFNLDIDYVRIELPNDSASSS